VALAASPHPDLDALHMCFDDYNSFGVAALQDKYKLGDSEKAAIKTIMFDIIPEVRTIMQRNLHKYKNQDSGNMLKHRTNREIKHCFAKPCEHLLSRRHNEMHLRVLVDK